jgi:hypothetical protein
MTTICVNNNFMFLSFIRRKFAFDERLPLLVNEDVDYIAKLMIKNHDNKYFDPQIYYDLIAFNITSMMTFSRRYNKNYSKNFQKVLKKFFTKKFNSYLDTDWKTKNFMISKNLTTNSMT